jgi:recombinational DNA repair ATPase RecF
MKIAKMTLKKYRNYDNLEVSFNDNLNIIIDF